MEPTLGVGVIAVTDDWHVAVTWSESGWAMFPTGGRVLGESNIDCALREAGDKAGIRLGADDLHYPTRFAVRELGRDSVPTITYLFALGVPKCALRTDLDPEDSAVRAAWVPLGSLRALRWVDRRKVAVSAAADYLESRRDASAAQIRVADAAARHGLAYYLDDARRLLRGEADNEVAVLLAEYDELAEAPVHSAEDARRVYGQLRRLQALERGVLESGTAQRIEREIVHRVVTALGGTGQPSSPAPQRSGTPG